VDSAEAGLPCFLLRCQAIGIHLYRYAFCVTRVDRLVEFVSFAAVCIVQPGARNDGTVPAQTVSFVSPRVARASSSLSPDCPSEPNRSESGELIVEVEYEWNAFANGLGVRVQGRACDVEGSPE
jgi:hypothetical protein